MNLRQIEAFRAVMMFGTMTAAARELHTSQPSISRLVTELEERLQFKLFVRGASRLTPTDEGSAFYREVEHSFSGLAYLNQAAHEIRVSGTGRLRIASIPAIAGLLPRVIKRFKARFPAVAILLEMRSEATVRRWTSVGYCDIGYASSVGESPNVHVDKLYQLPGVVVLPAEHRLAAQDQISLEDLRGESFISLSAVDNTRRLIDEAFERAGVNRHLSIETPYSMTLCALVAQGMGVSITNPLSMLDAPPGVVFRALSTAIPFFGFTVLPTDKVPSALARVFMEMTREVMHEQEWRERLPG